MHDANVIFYVGLPLAFRSANNTGKLQATGVFQNRRVDNSHRQDNRVMGTLFSPSTIAISSSS